MHLKVEIVFVLIIHLLTLVVDGSVIKVKEENKVPLQYSEGNVRMAKGVKNLNSEVDHNKHPHTRQGRCFFGFGTQVVDDADFYNEFGNEFAVPTEDIFNLDPRIETLGKPAGYQLVYRSGDHWVFSPMTSIDSNSKPKPKITILD